MIAFVPRRSRTKLWPFVVIVLLLAVVGGIGFLVWRQSVPGVRVTTTPPRFVGQRTQLVVAVEAARGNVVGAEARVVQGGPSVVVGKQPEPRAPRVELGLTLEPAALGLREGPATLEIWARDDFWRPFRRAERPVASYPFTIDITPPRLEVVATTPYVAPGGAGLVVFRAADAVRADARVGTTAFPTFAVGPNGTRVGFFALPWNHAPGTPIAVSAQDEAGNAASRSVTVEILPRRFRKDTIELKDTFLEAKVPELLPQRPSAQSLIDGFLVINRDQRRKAEEEKRRVAAKTADRPLWEGAFLQPRNTKVFSNFAESRTYVYKGQAVDTQVHFGFDLASTKQMPVPAANKGVVLYASPLTIYGNTVIVDHGLGLMTLYGHLSAIAVKPGDTVDKGQELGRSGNTGLAIGDHLHYEVLVHGMSVTPLEWWDAKWIRDRVSGPLQAAGLGGLSGGEARDGKTAAAEAPPRPRARRR
jgi:murein DD-endopeptidase MepM/ murein hydrolase activator NlpD